MIAFLVKVIIEFSSFDLSLKSHQILKTLAINTSHISEQAVGRLSRLP